MNGHTGKPIKIANKLACIGIGLGMFWWFLEAAVHVFVFHDGGLATQVLSPNLHEAWMRLLVVGLLVVFGIYAQSIIKQRERVARELKKHRNHLEELVSERNAELTRANEQLGQEIIEREGAEEALRKSEARLKSIVETVPSGLFTVDLNKRFTYWNKEAEEIVGLKGEEVIGRDCIEVLDCGECKTGCGLFDDKTDKPIYGKECVIHVDGKDIAILKNVDILRDLEGNTIGGLESFIDITKRKRAAEELRTSEERYRILAENVADGVGIVQDGKLTFANVALGSIFGYAVDELVGMESIGLFRDDYKHRYKQVLEDVEKNISPKRFQAPCIRGNGRQIWIEAGYNFIAWEGKHAVLVTVRDITEAKHREMAMQDESELLRRENVRLRSSMKERYRFGNIIGKSAAMQEVYDLILKAGATDASVVIYGESGTGKELVARTIHEMSDRKHKAFVPVNCGAIPETLFESELFGHRKGAFTGAHIDKHGFFDLASRGTLFLDEIGELSPTMQVKLLRAIEGGGYTPVGDTRTKEADVRIVVATNRHLMDMLGKGLIREDFLYRIHVIPVTLPPLRDRKEDIVLLVDHFLKLYGNGKERPTMPGRILNALYSHDWPGNIRELENVLKRYLTTERLDFIGTTHETDSMGPVSLAAGLHQGEGPGLRNVLEAFEKEYIGKLLARNQWHRTKTAAMLRIPERTLYRKLKQFQLTSS